MRVVGIDEDSASQHDDEIMVLGPEFESEMHEMGETIDLEIPSGTTIH